MSEAGGTALSATASAADPLSPSREGGDQSGLSPRESLTVVLTAFQEEEALGPLVAELFEALREVQSLEVVVVNDGSQDRTAEVMEGLRFPEGRAGRLTLAHLPTNQGMGAALQEGYRLATEEWVTFLPGDGQLAPSSLDALFQVAEAGAELVTTRYTNRSYTPLRWLLSKGLRLLSALIMGARVHSEGMYLIRRAQVQAMPLLSSSFMLNLELPIRAHRSGLKLGLAWIEVRERQGGRSSATQLSRISSTFRDLISLRYQLERERLKRPIREWGLFTKARLFSLLKLVIVGGCVLWASQSGLLSQTARQLKALSSATLLGAWLCMALGITLSAVRWGCLLRATHLYRPPLPQALRLCYEGLFFNVLVPGSVGGDLLRAHWLRRRDEGGSKLHFVVTVGERILGMLSLGLLMAFGVMSLPLSLTILALTLSVIALSPLLIQRLTREGEASLKEEGEGRGALSRLGALLRPLSTLKRRWVITALCVNISGHFTSFAMFILMAQDFGVNLPLQAWLVSLSVALFFANLPISIAGVGPRELSMVAALGVYGVSEEQALALSLSSLALLITHALLGGLLHLIWPSSAAKA